MSFAYHGIHHVEGWRRRTEETSGYAISVNIYHDIATFDFDTLTRLVVGAHHWCCRIAIMQGGPRGLKLWISLRDREGDFSCRHPTIEQAIAAYNLPKEEPNEPGLYAGRELSEA